MAYYYILQRRTNTQKHVCICIGCVMRVQALLLRQYLEFGTARL